MARRYSQEQLASVLDSAGASSWEDVLRALEREEVRPAGLTHDQLSEMQDDLQKLADREERFNADAGAAYAMIESIQPERTVIGPGSPTPEADVR